MNRTAVRKVEKRARRSNKTAQLGECAIIYTTCAKYFVIVGPIMTVNNINLIN